MTDQPNTETSNNADKAAAKDPLDRHPELQDVKIKGDITAPLPEEDWPESGR